MKFFLRVCGALFYDLLSVLVLVYFASFLPIILLESSIKAGNIKLQLFITVIAMLYFFYCFKKGRTFGMQAWRLELQSETGSKVTDYQICVRIIAAIFSFLFFGLGYLYMLFDHKNRTLHDIASKTYLRQKSSKQAGS
tara:strand:+ start:414 stop:827 length:414 start_codon:yes stop_codon:yes gene_type:complete